MTQDMSSPKTKAFHREHVPNPNTEGLASFLFQKHLLLSFSCLDEEIMGSFIWEDKDNHPVCDQTKKKKKIPSGRTFSILFFMAGLLSRCNQERPVIYQASTLTALWESGS